jgi:hypothetical protein
MLPRVESSQPGTKIGRFGLGRGQQPRVLRVDLVAVLEHPAAKDAVHELVREQALADLVRAHPLGEHRVLDAPHRLHLGDAGVGDAVHVPVEQRLLVLGRQLPVVRHALVVVVGDQVEHVLLEVRAGAADRVDLALADHLREADPELRRAHRPTQGHEHLPAARQVPVVALGCVDQGGRIKMAVMPADKAGDRSILHVQAARIRDCAAACGPFLRGRRASASARDACPRALPASSLVP